MIYPEDIKAICDAQRAINKVCTFSKSDLTLSDYVNVKVSNIEDVYKIAEIIYGREALDEYKVHRDENGYRTAFVTSPQGVCFCFSDYDLEKAGYFHVREAEFLEDGGIRVTDRDVKAGEAL